MEPISEDTTNNISMNINDNQNTELISEDIQSMINVLNLCCQRGAFRVGEMKDIGLFYERLNLLKKNIDSK